IGQITLDNASNNNTLMVALEQELSKRHILFHSDGNRIRCNWEQYREGIAGEPVGGVRSIVSSCRASSLRRRDLQRTITEGNEQGSWTPENRVLQRPNDHPNRIRNLQLLRDCETRWSSIFLMTDRYLYLHPCVSAFLEADIQWDISHYNLTSAEVQVLLDLHMILEVAHKAQELLSSEQTPALSIALPAYETIITKWKQLRATIPELAFCIDAGIAKLEEYMAETRKSRIYAHAMGKPTVLVTVVGRHSSIYSH
ncbi:hypothetical protein BKA70DRAFT_1126566, partial [Coprinopsis sp. MPI-PUGE-AT-0042]